MRRMSRGRTDENVKKEEEEAEEHEKEEEH